MRTRGQRRARRWPARSRLCIAVQGWRVAPDHRQLRRCRTTSNAALGSHLLILNFVEWTHPGTEQGDARPPVHCALVRFQPIDLPFSLTVAPRLDHGIADRLYVDHQSPAKLTTAGMPHLLASLSHGSSFVSSQPRSKPWKRMARRRITANPGTSFFRTASIPTWRSVSRGRGFMQIAAATTGEMREPDAGSSGNERTIRSAGAGDELARARLLTCAT